MRFYKIWTCGIFAALTSLVSCKVEKEGEMALQLEIGEVKRTFAPDGRTALFNISAKKEQKGYVLYGETTSTEAARALKEGLKAQGLSFVDSIKVLPAADMQGNTEGVITLSVANLRAHPAHSSELVTQATLGTPVKIYKRKGDWWYIQTPDRYLAWMDGAGLTPMQEERFRDWRAAKKIIYTQTTGNSLSLPEAGSQPVSDVVAGSILELLDKEKDFYKVQYPDGRIAYVAKGEARNMEEWVADLDPDGTSLVETAKQLMGLPYLWGGTSTKGVDCSGFTKTVYFLNGIVIPRDASQQVHTGKIMDSVGAFDKLVAGDLLFFGRKATDSTKEKVVHVGMWIGNNEFIHSAGRVHISSINKEAPNYDVHNHNRYLRSKRILKERDPDLLDLAAVPLFGTWENEKGTTPEQFP